MGFKLLNPTGKEPNMALTIVFIVVCLAVAQAKYIDTNQNENWSNWQRGSYQHFHPSNYNMRARNFARRSGCTRGCLMCLSQIQCTDKMKEFIPGKCHNSWLKLINVKTVQMNASKV